MIYVDSSEEETKTEKYQPTKSLKEKHSDFDENIHALFEDSIKVINVDSFYEEKKTELYQPKPLPEKQSDSDEDIHRAYGDGIRVISVNSSDEEKKTELYKPKPLEEKHPDSDEDIHKAYEESLKKESILPLLKQELRWKIQTRRLSEGQEELKPEKQEAKIYELSEEEKEKNRRRLIQNRESLRRSRIKELEYENTLKMMYDSQIAQKEMLQKRKAELLKEKASLLKKFYHAGLEYDENTSTVTCTFCKITSMVSKR